MHLPLAMDVAFPLIALLVAVVLVAAILGLRRRRSSDATPEPSNSDWIGNSNEYDNSNNEDSNGNADRGVGVRTARRVNVAQAVAERDPDTAPLPASSTAVPGPDTTPPTDGGPTAAGTSVGKPPRRPRSDATQTQPDAAAPELPSTAHPSPETAAPVAQQQQQLTATPPLSAARSATAAAVNPGDGPPPPMPARTGEPTSSGDVRDRLLAVLLDNPTHAVHAVTELDSTRGHLDRLTEALDAIRRERDVLGDVLTRLVATGLRPDQLAKLAGLPLAEVHDLLPASAPSRP